MVSTAARDAIHHRPIRLLALDVDGTLLDPDEQITPRVRSAVQAALEQGCLVTLATGRRLLSARHIAAELGLSLPLILHGGAVVQESSTGAVLYDDPLDPAVVQAIVATMLAHDAQPIVYESPAVLGRLYAGSPTRDNDAIRQYAALRGPILRVDDAALGTVPHALQVAALAAPGELAALATALQQLPGVGLLRGLWHVVPCCEAIEVYRAGCSKARALRELAAMHSIAMDEVMAIGDGLNDCDILAAVGLGVAMGNACPEACAAARLQVGSNAQDGVAEAIERFVLAPAAAR